MKLDIQKMIEEHQYGRKDADGNFKCSFETGRLDGYESYRDTSTLADKLLLTPATYERVLEIESLEDAIKWQVKHRRKIVSELRSHHYFHNDWDRKRFILDSDLLREQDLKIRELKEHLKQLKKELKQNSEFKLRFDTTDLSTYKEVA